MMKNHQQTQGSTVINVPEWHTQAHSYFCRHGAVPLAAVYFTLDKDPICIIHMWTVGELVFALVLDGEKVTVVESSKLSIGYGDDA